MWEILLGIICLLYFIFTMMYTGVGFNFYFIWAIMGTGLIVFGIAKHIGIIERIIPVFFKRTCFIFLLLGIFVFVIVEIMILSGFLKQGEKNLDYLIVLGAQVKENGPSRALEMRLDKAYDYMIENEHTIAIVSGGQGSNEPESEALCMKKYLVNRGIVSERIVMEDQSVNTKENLAFSKQFIKDEEASVGIVSNNFHIFRAVGIARKEGFHEVYGIAAKSDIWLQPNNMFREFFAVAKDYLFGNM